jgi:cytochrome c biogenesis protein CcmG, thiol:disulfide interchange protein DsbE
MNAEVTRDTPRRKVAPFITLALALVIASVVVVLARAPKGDRPDTAATPLLGKPAPDIAGVTIDGGSFSLSSRRGSWVAVNFFQTSCTPCRIEHPELAAFVARQPDLPADRQTEFVTVVWVDTAENVRQFFAEKGGSWPVVLDDAGQIGFAYSMAKVPETWIIDPNGLVRKRLISTVTAVGLQAEIDVLRQQVI